MRKRVVIWPNEVSPLLLRSVCYRDGEAIEGEVENGGWLYRRVGQQHQACETGDRRRVVTRWDVTAPTLAVNIPEDIKGDYNDVIIWAETQR